MMMKIRIQSFYYNFLLVIGFFIYFYPVSFKALPVSTGIILLILGIVFFGLFFSIKKIFKPILTYFVSGIAIFTIGSISSCIVNDTGDLSFSIFGLTCITWFIKAFFLCYIVYKLYRTATINLVLEFIVIVTIIQAIISLMFFVIPSTLEFYYSMVDIDETLKMFQEDNASLRLIGVGSMQYATSAAHYGIVLWILIYLRAQNTFNNRILFIIIISILSIAGVLSGRTFFILLALTIPFTLYINGANINSLRILLDIFLPLSLITIIAFIFLYSINPESVNWVFEIFINMFYNNSLSVESESTNSLSEMYIWPNDPKTWIIGDGRAQNPYGFGFYKNTDVGYVRGIYYWGIIGSLIFYSIQIFQYYIIKKLYPSSQFKKLNLFILLFLFIFHFKDFWNLNSFYALFIAFGSYSYYHNKFNCKSKPILR